MKKVILYFLLTTGGTWIQAQVPDVDYNNLPIDTAALCWQKGRNVDLVKERILRSKDDTNKVWADFMLSVQNTFNDPATALTYAQHGEDLAKKIHFEAGENYCNDAI